MMERFRHLIKPIKCRCGGVITVGYAGPAEDPAVGHTVPECEAFKRMDPSALLETGEGALSSAIIAMAKPKVMA
jgi:hypothetical protein